MGSPAVCTLGVGVSGPSSLDVGSSPLVSDCTGREVSLSFNGVNRAYYRGHVVSTACLLPTLSHRKREISSRALCLLCRSNNLRYKRSMLGCRPIASTQRMRCVGSFSRAFRVSIRSLLMQSKNSTLRPVRALSNILGLQQYRLKAGIPQSLLSLRLVVVRSAMGLARKAQDTWCAKPPDGARGNATGSQWASSAWIESWRANTNGAMQDYDQSGGATQAKKTRAGHRGGNARNNTA